MANVELENVKRVKETTEQELKGCEVELSLNETAIQTLEVLFLFLLHFTFIIASPLIVLLLLKFNLSTPGKNLRAAR